MVKIQFVHTSDWHLGYTQYNKIERNRDFKDAALKLVDKIINIKPDFVLHTGDVFHLSKPSPSTIIQSVEILSKLKKSKIPIYVVRGNHDGGTSNYLSKEGGVLKLLDELNLIKYIDDEIINLDNLNVKILGVGYYHGTKINDKIEEILSENENFLGKSTFNIVAIHGFVEGQMENDIQISLKKIKDIGVNYFGAGHYHIPWRDEINDIYAPGSLECTKISDAYRNDIINNISMFSSFYEINSEMDNEKIWTKLNVKEHKISTRPKVLLNYISKMDSIENIKNELDNKIQIALNAISEIDFTKINIKPILNLKLGTNLQNNETSKLRVLDWYENKFLHIITNIDGIASNNLLDDYNNLGVEKEIITDLLKKDKFLKIEDIDFIYQFMEIIEYGYKSQKLSNETVNLISQKIHEMENFQLQKNRRDL